MKISKKETINKIKLACSVAAKNGSFAALSNVAIEVTDRVKLTCGDGQVQINSAFDADIDVEFATTVNAQKFSTAIDSCNEEIEIFSQHEKLIIKSGRKKYELKTMPIDTYPVYPQYDFELLDIKATDLISTMNSVSHYMGKDDARYYMNGIALNGNGIQSSYRGHTFAWNKKDLGVELIIPYDTANKLLSMDLSGTRVLSSINMIKFESDDFSITSTLIDGRFPDVKRALPESDGVKVTVNGNDIRAAIKAIDFINDGFIRLKSENGEMEISAESKVKDTAQDFIPCDGDIELKVDPGYLKKLIGATTQDDITIEFWPDRNMMIVNEDNLTQIVMTIK